MPPTPTPNAFHSPPDHHHPQSLRKQIFQHPRPPAYYARASEGAHEAHRAPANQLFGPNNPPRFIPVVMIAAFRPDYLKRVLSNLERCDGVSRTVLIVSQVSNKKKII